MKDKGRGACYGLDAAFDPKISFWCIYVCMCSRLAKESPDSGGSKFQRRADVCARKLQDPVVAPPHAEINKPVLSKWFAQKAVGLQRHLTSRTRNSRHRSPQTLSPHPQIFRDLGAHGQPSEP